MQRLAKIFARKMCRTDLAGSRDAPNVSTLPPNVTLFAVKEAISLLQELQKKISWIVLTPTES